MLITDQATAGGGVGGVSTGKGSTCVPGGGVCAVCGPSLTLQAVPILVLGHVGGGEAWGRTTGAKALFCLTADTMLAGEKEKMPEEELQLEGRLVDEAMVGLEGTTAGREGERPGVTTEREQGLLKRERK